MITIIAAVVLLGVLIFVHELGHFLVARLVGVGVPVFSLGFGPKIIGKKIGETEYRLSAFPLGGYVKMIGEDPGEDVEEIDKDRSFSEKALHQRVAILFAGPLFNIIFPIIVLAIIYMIGIPAQTTLIGMIEGGSPAHLAGIRSGDRIVSIDGKSLWKWPDMKDIIQKNAENLLHVQVMRGNDVLEFDVTTISKVIQDPIFGEETKVGILGISPLALSPHIGIKSTASPAYRTGLRSGDEVKGVDDDEIKTWYQLMDAIESRRGKEVKLTCIRDGDELTIKFLVPEAPKYKLEDTQYPLKEIPYTGIEVAELYIESVTEGSPAEEAGLKRGDKIIKINSEPVKDWYSLAKTIQGSPENAVTIEFSRLNFRMVKKIVPRRTTVKDYVGRESEIGIIGIKPMNEHKEGEFKLERLGPFMATTRATVRVYEITGLILKSLYKIILRDISLKNVGGPIMIIKIAGDSAKSGLFPFLRLLVLISINLGIINLLPIPVLDGGHIFMAGVEMIRGRPLSPKRQELIQRIGISILVLIMVLAFYNDLMRFKGDIVELFKKLISVFN